MIDVTTLQTILTTARDYALIVLAVAGLFIGIGMIALLAPLLRGLRQLRRQLPWVMHRAQTATATARRGVEQASQVIATPFLWLRRVSAQTRSLGQRLRTRLDSVTARGR